jgi:SAM-dependent methyltransferase
MSHETEIRDNVSKAYARAVTAPAAEGGCCGGSPQKGFVVKLAGYTSDELEALPGEAVVNSFGCGNPLAFSEVQPGDVVLDLGSGAGIDLLLASKKVGPTGRVIGVDMTDEMIEKARENILAADAGNVEVRKGIIEDLPVEDASVDWVISNCVINLSPDKRKVFSEIARVLKPGGRMQVSDIVVEKLPDWVRKSEAFYNTCIAGAISEGAYAEGLREAGLMDVEVLERIRYDTAQVKGLIDSELPQNAESIACCGVPEGVTVEQTAAVLAGDVWSAKIRATKSPG